MGTSARAFSTNLLTELVNQAAHGFTVGQVLVYSAGLPGYVLAKADNTIDSAGCLMVSVVATANSFYTTQNGYVSGLPFPVTAGSQYYLSPSISGSLTSTSPTEAGQIILPCFTPDSTSSGYFYTGTGQIIQPGGLLKWVNASANQILSINQGYYVTANNLTLTLPVASNVGDRLVITNYSGNGFTIAQNNVPSQKIYGLNASSSAGSGGSVVASLPGSTLDMVCLQTSTNWQILNDNGGLQFN